MTNNYLWLDFETTGLDPLNLTVLECAWTVTDENFKQLTPLTSRYCYIPTSEAGGSNPIVGGWEGAPIPPIVQEMHYTSGLHADWLGAYRDSMVVGSSELDEAILASVYRAGWDKGTVLHLAGAGVSHFDRPVLDAMKSELVTGAPPLLHYRAIDTSCALGVMGVPAPKSVESLLSLTETLPASTIKLTTMIADENVAGFGPGRGMLLPRAVGHRAAGDVAFSLVLARCLRSMVV